MGRVGRPPGTQTPLATGHISRREWLRFLSHLDMTVPCDVHEGPSHVHWCWRRPSGNGYGYFSCRGQRSKATHFAWIALKGPLPSDTVLDHLCRTRSCVNPSCLEPVIEHVNLLRGVGLASINALKTHCPHGHPYSESNTFREKDGSRKCRVCVNTRNARYRAELRSQPRTARLQRKPRICKGCGRTFFRKNPKRLFHSRQCWYAFASKPQHDFWSLVDTSPHPQGCWLFTGALRKHKHNYGRYRRMLVHRYAYSLYYPDVTLTASDFICHTCDNYACVRKEHLFKGTAADNNADAWHKGRHAHGGRAGGAKLTDALVTDILTQWRQGTITQRALCTTFGVSPSQMSLIVNRKAWKHVEAQR
jgi:hypothetical protein